MKEIEHKRNYFSLVYGLVLFIGGITSFLLFGLDTFNPKINFIENTSGYSFLIMLLLGWIMFIYGIISFFHVANSNVFVRLFNKILPRKKTRNDNKVAIILTILLIIILPILLIIIQPTNYQKEFKRAQENIDSMMEIMTKSKPKNIEKIIK